MLYACAAGVGAYVPGGPQPGASAPRPLLPAGVVGGGADPFTGANARPASTAAPAGALTFPKPLFPRQHTLFTWAMQVTTAPWAPAAAVPTCSWAPACGLLLYSACKFAFVKEFSLHQVTEQQGALRVASFPLSLRAAVLTTSWAPANVNPAILAARACVERRSPNDATTISISQAIAAWAFPCLITHHNASKSLLLLLDCE